MRDKLKYVALISHQNGGKDYVANYIAKTVERKVEIVKFATKLVEVTAQILGVTDLTLFQNREWKDKPHFIWQSNITSNNGKLISPREALCIVGSLMRSVDHNIWVRGLQYSCNDPDTLYITSDLRYQNEANFVKANNGLVVYIENQQAAEAQRRKEAGVVHESERLVWDMHYSHAVPMPDYVLNNNDYSNPKPLQDLLTFLSTVV
jgi:hypothetical protein